MTVSPAPQQDFAHYEIERLLGRGAIGTVYLARDRRIGRRVALKTIQIRSDQFDDTTAEHDFYERLQREAEVCGALLHPNIVTLYEAGYDGDRVSYLAMEYIEGETLQHMMQGLGRIAPDVAVRIATDVLRGLEFAHAKGIVHRDIKPANILIADDGTAKVADFGIARLPHSSLTGAGSLMGTPNYIAPEQILGRTATTQADIFSLGATMFEMLTATKPFAGSDVTSVLHNVLRRDVPHASDVNPDVPRATGDLVARMLAKEPNARPAANEILCGAGNPAGERRESSGRLASATQSYVRMAAIAAITLIACGVVWLIAAISLSGSGPKPAFTRAQLDEFAQKRRALAAAQQSIDDGRFEDAEAQYNAYLAKYPWSTVAQDGRARAGGALAKHTHPHRRRTEEDISPSELLRRLKRKVFRP